MRKARPASAIATAVAAVLLIVFAPVAVTAEVQYAGTWECDAVPKLNVPPVRVPGEAIRDGDRLTVSRIVHKAGTTEEAGRTRGTTVVRDGRFVVEMAGAGIRFTGRFEGTASDAEIELKGIERLTFPDLGDGERSCRATLKRR